jgi:hypothetical protein
MDFKRRLNRLPPMRLIEQAGGYQIEPAATVRSCMVMPRACSVHRKPA